MKVARIYLMVRLGGQRGKGLLEVSRKVTVKPEPEGSWACGRTALFARLV